MSKSSKRREFIRSAVKTGGHERQIRRNLLMVSASEPVYSCQRAGVRATRKPMSSRL